MPQLFRTAAITDEFSPDIQTAVASMAGIGMQGAELRMLFGKNIADLNDEEVERAIAIVRGRGLEIVSIASPLLKCVLPDSPDVDPRFQQDMFAAKHTFADQPRLTRRVFEIAGKTGAKIVRVFSFWRTVDPDAVFDRVVHSLRDLGTQAADHGITIGIENEHACNIGTGAETARLLAALNHPNVKVVWDPANALVAGENPYPEGYGKLPTRRILHVHAKDCNVRDHKAEWLPLGQGSVDWRGQIAALARDGYTGWVSLETHWGGPGGDKHEASMICGRALQELVSAPSGT
ncbi:MAG TPA: sugar phosphate isomerase/epimerase family protein [Candidatus Limnocylindrales bacterium]|nr:sugar phosphate isomerase/epimerase family protein [Candidatus Limnocylindrales bacterium]